MVGVAGTAGWPRTPPRAAAVTASWEVGVEPLSRGVRCCSAQSAEEVRRLLEAADKDCWAWQVEGGQGSEVATTLAQASPAEAAVVAAVVGLLHE